MHNIKLIQRRFPKHAARMIMLLIILSASALAIGLGLLILP